MKLERKVKIKCKICGSSGYAKEPECGMVNFIMCGNRECGSVIMLFGKRVKISHHAFKKVVK